MIFLSRARPLLAVLGMLLLGILRAAVGLIRSWVLLYMSA